MPSPRSAERARLDLSERVALSFVDDGFGQTVASLCRALDVPERTFFNYFPTKADAIRPILERGIRTLVGTLAEDGADRSLEEALVAGFESSLWGENGRLTARLVRSVLVEPALNAVWLSTIRSFEAALAEAVRARTGTMADSAEEHMIAATLVASVRISFEHMATHGTEPVVTFRRALGAVSFPGLRD
jgi:AcrR family transcriptional regulator